MTATTTSGSSWARGHRTELAAFPKDVLQQEKFLPGEIGETPVVAVFDERYETGYVYLNPEDQAYDYDDGSVVDP